MELFSKQLNYRQFIKYLAPSVLTMVFLSFYTTIDGYFVSKYAGSDALAGINIVIPVTCVIFGTSIMLAAGGGAIIGELRGRGERQRADGIFSFLTLALAVFSVVFAAVGMVFLKPICVLLGASPRLLPHVLPYAFVVFAGTGVMAFKLFFEYLVRTDGRPQMAFAMSVVGLVLNVVLDYVFVGVCGMGTLGAAVGTVLSIGVSALMGLVYFLKYSSIRFCRPRSELGALRKACINGGGEMLTELSTGITTLLFNLIIIERFGEDGIAAVTIIMYIYYFFVAFYMGISVAAAPVISYNLGAGNRAKIRATVRQSFVTIGITAAAIMAALWWGGSFIIGIFTPEGHVFHLTLTALKYFSPVFIFIGVNVFLSGYFTALGEGATAAAISFLRSFGFVAVYVYVLPVLVGDNGVWLAMPASEVSTLPVSLLLFFLRGVGYFRGKKGDCTDTGN